MIETSWRGIQSESRERYLAKFDFDEVQRYEKWIRMLAREDDLACLADIATGLNLVSGMKVLDVGAGTGAMCKILTNISGLHLTALEPASAMIDQLQSKSELRDVKVVQGFCDADEDRHLLESNSYDVITARHLVNGLFDPITAFRNWLFWLKPGGWTVVLDGFYERSAWSGAWTEEVDVLPMSACQSTAMVPYLMELAGFEISLVTMMHAINKMPSTKTPRYIVFARKPVDV